MRKKFSLILQRDSMQCGASCLAMICSYFEKNKCIEYLSEQCFATTERVSLPYWTRKYVSGCISVPIPCRTIAIGRLYPTRSLQGRYSTRLRTWKGCWRRITILSPFEFSIIIRLKILINKYCQYRILPIPLYPKLN